MTYIEYEYNSRWNKYIYNFISEGKKVNQEFMSLGNKVKNGISSKLNPLELKEFLNNLSKGSIMELDIKKKLDKADSKLIECSGGNCSNKCNMGKIVNCENIKERKRVLKSLKTIMSFSDCIIKKKET